MIRSLALAGLVGLLLAAAAPRAQAQKKKLDVMQTWSGSVDDDKLMKPPFIASAKEFDALWKAWKVPGDVPKVDFAKNIVVAAYSVGSKLNLAGATLDEKGNLEVLGFGTRDIRPGFRYVLGVVSREGVKSVNKKALPPG
jgi:hypothetical protein